MYRQFESGDTITFFCDGKSEKSGKNKRKRKSTTAEDASDSAHGDHEQQIKKIALELADIHGEKYNDNQLRLWARMMVNKQHDDMHHPPNIPLITGGVKKTCPKGRSLTDTISGAATAFVKALASHRASPQKPPQPCAATNAINTGVSPSSKARLSGQYIEQLKSLQELRESGVLSEKEFEEQKTFALQNIRGLNKNISCIYHGSSMYDYYYMHMTVLHIYNFVTLA